MSRNKSKKENDLHSILRTLSESTKLTENEVVNLINDLISITGERPEDFFLTLVNFAKEKIIESKDQFPHHLGQQFTYAMQLVREGSKLQRDVVAVGAFYGAWIYGVSLNDLIECAEMIDSLYKRALDKDESAIIKVNQMYFGDLLRVPKPTPEIPRGYFDIGPILASMFEGVLKDEEKTKFVKASEESIPLMKKWAESLTSPDYARQWVSRVLDGYKDLVEGDFKALLSWLIALSRIVRGQIVKYNELRRKNIAKKVEELRALSYSKLVDCYERHLRNSIAHTDYHFDVEHLIITFRDREWEKSMNLLEFKALHSKMACLVDLSLLICDPENKQLELKLSQHRDPAWWERIRKLKQK